MTPPPPPVDLPSSYASLGTSHIALSHVPASSPTPTPVIVLTLNRPSKNNAFTGTMMEEFERVYAMFDVDDRVKCVVITGAGKMFCAGADLEIGFLGGKTKGGEASRQKTERDSEHRDGSVTVSVTFSDSADLSQPGEGGSPLQYTIVPNQRLQQLMALLWAWESP